MAEKDETKRAAEELTEAVNNLDEDIQQLDTHIEKLTNRLGFWPVVLRGILTALAYAIGGAIVLGAIAYVLEYLTGVPILGELFQLILDQVSNLRA